MKRKAWMPIYPGDYLRDTVGLTLAEHGAYLLVILAYWSNGGPLDDAFAMRIASTEANRVRQFFKVKDNKWHHKRIDAELARSAKVIEARSKAGKAAAHRRWGKGNKRNANEQHMNAQSQYTDGYFKTPPPGWKLNERRPPNGKES